MLRFVMTAALSLQLICCPIECLLGVCGCRAEIGTILPRDTRCTCCENGDRTASTEEGPFRSIHEDESPGPLQSTPVPGQPGPRKNKNCICHGALKSDASGDWNISREITQLVSIEVPTAIGYSNLPVISRWVLDSRERFFGLTGRQTRTWQQSFLC